MNNVNSYKIPDVNKFSDSSKKAIFQICEDIMLFLIFYPIALNFLGILCKNTPALMHGISLLIYALALTLIRTNIKKRPLAIILSLVLFCIFLVIPFELYERILYGLYAVLMLALSIKEFFKPSFKFFKTFLFICGEALLFINLFWAYGANNSLVKELTLFSAIAFSLIFLFYSSRSRYKLLIASEKNSSLSNAGDLSSKKFIIALFASFLILISCVLLVTNKLNSNSNSAVVHAIYNALNSQMPQSPADLKYIGNLSKDKEDRTHLNMGTIANKQKGNSDLPIYAYLVAYLALAALIIFIAFKILKLVLNIKIKDQETETETEATFLKEDLKKDLGSIIPKFNFNLSNKEKLRKYYKKSINSYRKKGLSVKDSSTSQELQDGILNLTGNDLETITKLYDKCRYTTYEPTKEDIATVRKNAKK